MTEPIYDYVPGQGWVLSSSMHIVTMSCGTRVRLENRPPKAGEVYERAGASNYWGHQDAPNWEQWEHWFKRKNKTYDAWLKSNRDHTPNPNAVYMTAVKL